MSHLNNTEIGLAHSQMVTDLVKHGEDILTSLTPEKCNDIHMAMGISGEAGELLDAIKKYTIYNKPIDLENVVEELGDLEFYMEGIRQSLGITREQTLAANTKKLLTGKNARYSSGSYSDKQAQERADKKEAAPVKKPKLLIMGHAGHGKDGAARVLGKLLGLSFISSSRAALDKVMWPHYSSTCYAYRDKEECFVDRANLRSEWHELIKEYNTPDKTRLAKEILSENDMYVGMRCADELRECIRQKVFDCIIAVDAGDRVPKENAVSNSIRFPDAYADVTVNNSFSKEKFILELIHAATNIATAYGLEFNPAPHKELLLLLDHEDVAQTLHHPV